MSEPIPAPHVWHPMPIPADVTPCYIGRQTAEGGCYTAFDEEDRANPRIFMGWTGPEFTDAFGTRKSGVYEPATHWLWRDMPSLPPLS